MPRRAVSIQASSSEVASTAYRDPLEQRGGGADPTRAEAISMPTGFLEGTGRVQWRYEQQQPDQPDTDTDTDGVRVRQRYGHEHSEFGSPSLGA